MRCMSKQLAEYVQSQWDSRAKQSRAMGERRGTGKVIVCVRVKMCVCVMFDVCVCELNRGFSIIVGLELLPIWKHRLDRCIYKIAFGETRNAELSSVSAHKRAPKLWMSDSGTHLFCTFDGFKLATVPFAILMPWHRPQLHAQTGAGECPSIRRHHLVVMISWKCRAFELIRLPNKWSNFSINRYKFWGQSNSSREHKNILANSGHEIGTERDRWLTW